MNMAEEDLSCSTECRDSDREMNSGLQVSGEMNEEDSNSNTGEWHCFEPSDGLLLRCDRCDFESSCRDTLVRHSATCQASGVLLCERCDYETVCRDSLANHISTCQGDGRKMFECDICLIKFSSGANMRRHRLRHTGIKPFECRVCHKRFFRKDHLAEHASTHAKPLPHTCPVCSRGFQRHIAMRAHFQNEHVGRPDPVTKACPLCSFTASSMKSLRLHFFNRHGIDLDKGAAANDDVRQIENGSPPMHFLTPHVEISMAETSHNRTVSPKTQGESSGEGSGGEASEGIASPPHPPVVQASAIVQSLNAPPVDMSNHGLTPHVSLIPIKQEVASSPQHNQSQQNHQPPVSSLIKVSPLKSLLREEPRGVADQTHDWTRPTRLSCQFCGISFPDRTLYFLHKGCHSTDSNPWKCNICGEQTSNVYDFNSHLLSKSHH